MVFQTSKLEPSVRVACDYSAPQPASSAAAHTHFVPLQKYSMCQCANTICSTAEIQLVLVHKCNFCHCDNSLIVNLIVNDDKVWQRDSSVRGYDGTMVRWYAVWHG